MSDEYNPLSSISWQLKRIADALEEMNEINRPKDNESINKLRKTTKANEKPRAWNKLEEKQLRELLDENTSIKEIAQILDRTEGAIRSRIRNQLNLKSPHHRNLRKMLKTKTSSLDE